MSSNGVDLGAIYQAIVAIAADLTVFKTETQAEFRQVRSDFREIRHEIAELRQTVREYPGSVMGHGMHITERDERLTRLEQQRQA